MNAKSKILYRLWAISTIFLGLASVNGLSLLSVSAADRVFLRTPSGIGESRVVGDVEDFTGHDLVLRHPSGRLQTFKSDRVLRVESEWSPPHQLARASYQRRKYQDSLDEYLKALRIETRKWVQRQQLARITLCYRNLGKLGNSSASFLALYRSDATALHFSAIPLVWSSRPPDVAVESRAMALLADAEQPVAQLIGASWLLTTAKRPQALETLRSLSNAKDARVIFLAEAQIWRTQLATLTDADMTRMQTRVEAMPQSIRGGPYFLLGSALAQRGQSAQAALSFLRIPINFPEDRTLAAQALLATGRELETINRSGEARELYRELIVDYAGTPMAATAQERFETRP
jgi:tetratricopeptide (TPR) repeat protein